MITQKTVDLIKQFESAHDGDLNKEGLQPKMDPIGIWTVGYGHVPLDTKGNRYIGVSAKEAVYKHPLANLTLKQAEDLLLKDLNEVYLPRTLEMLTRKDLNDDQIGALTSFVYNCGTSYKNSKGQIIPYAIWANINNRMNDKDLFNYWSNSVVTAGGKTLAGLVRRRKSEATLYLTGQLKFNF